MTSLTSALKLEVEKARPEINVFHWDRSRYYGKLKDGKSYVCPVENGVWKGSLIIQIRDRKLHSHVVSEWRRYE